MEIQNAKIEGTTLGYEGHGILTIELHVGYGSGSAQSFGGYALHGEGPHLRNWIEGILKTVGVDSWEEVKEKYIRVEKESAYGKILRIGNFLEDKWFDPKSADPLTDRSK